jgi:hypothetical protein
MRWPYAAIQWSKEDSLRSLDGGQSGPGNPSESFRGLPQLFHELPAVAMLRFLGEVTVRCS